jgi:hypothetical protein
MSELTTEELLALAAGMAVTAKKLAEEAEDRHDWRAAAEYWQAANYCQTLAGKLERARDADARRKGMLDERYR